jgi:hypothetical protein
MISRKKGTSLEDLLHEWSTHWSISYNIGQAFSRHFDMVMSNDLCILSHFTHLLYLLLHDVI